MIKKLVFLFFAFAMVTSLSAQTTFSDVTEEQGVSVYFQGASFGCGSSFYDFDGDGWDDLTFGLNNSQIKFYKNNEGVLEQVTFPGIDNSSEAKAVHWVDFDNDGDADFFVSNRFDRVKLFENNGDMTFVDVSDSAGLNNDFEMVNWGASWGDYDRDGFLDLYVCKATADHELASDPNMENDLYHNNGDGTFTEVSDFAQVGDSIGISFQSSFLDYDQDGWQDLMV
ncbi:MAG: FG-GAP repeat domain-containing protein, partial [Flavobacteriales bacterium]